MLRTVRTALLAVLPAVASLLLAPLSASAQTISFAANSNLTAAQQAEITAAHQEALTAVTNALAYMRSTAVNNVRGQNNAYNSNLGQFYDPTANNTLQGQYDNELYSRYAAVRLQPMAIGSATVTPSFTDTVIPNPFGSTPATITIRRYYVTSGFVVSGPPDGSTGLVREDFWRLTNTGTLYDPLDPKNYYFVHAGTGLYDSSAISNFNALTTARASITVPTSGSSSSSSTLIKAPNISATTGSSSSNQIPVFNLTAIPAGPRTQITAAAYQALLLDPPTGPARLMHPTENVGNSLNFDRSNDMITLLESLRTALLQNATYNGNLYASGNAVGSVGAAAQANRDAIRTALSAGVGDNNRGFQEYGYSTSNSVTRQNRDIAMLTNPALDFLNWFEDIGTRDANNNLLPGQRDRFFEDKFGLLVSGSTVYIGKSALNGVEQVNNGIFDSSKRDGQYQNTSPLFQRIIEAFTAGITQGGRTAQFGLNQINANNGNVNIQTSGGNTTYFPQDRDVKAISSYVSTVRNNPAIPIGKVGIASRALSAIFSSTSIVVPIP